MLKLNESKTEVLMISTRQQLKKGLLHSIRVGDVPVNVSNQAKNLGVVFDEQLNMDAHVDAICRSAHYTLFNIRKIRKYLDRNTAECVIHAFVSSRLDYCNALLLGVSKMSLHKLQ